MHGPFEKAPNGEPNIYQSWSMKLVAVPLLFVIALIGYAVSHPGMAKWVADGVEAEFVSSAVVPESSPTRIAQPTNQSRAVTAH